jgi:peptidoglycan/xylan/chitin deacetylase (PgdA/CDA1 family)
MGSRTIERRWTRGASCAGASCVVVLLLGLGVMDRTAVASSRTKSTDGNLWGLSRFRGGGLIRGFCARRPCIALTFDDGPNYETTPRVLDELDRRSVRATFFVTGHRMDGDGDVAQRNRETLRDTWRRGHLVGNHTYHHDSLDTMDEHRLDFEIDRTGDLIERTLGARTWLFRAPYGAFHATAAVHAVFSRGLTPVFWAIDSRDWAVHTPDEVLANFRAGLDASPRGGVVLFHDTLEQTAEVLPRIFDEIAARNQARRAAAQPVYEFVGIDELWHPVHADVR